MWWAFTMNHKMPRCLIRLCHIDTSFSSVLANLSHFVSYRTSLFLLCGKTLLNVFQPQQWRYISSGLWTFTYWFSVSLNTLKNYWGPQRALVDMGYVTVSATLEIEMENFKLFSNITAQTHYIMTNNIFIKSKLYFKWKKTVKVVALLYFFQISLISALIEDKWMFVCASAFFCKILFWLKRVSKCNLWQRTKRVLLLWTFPQLTYHQPKSYYKSFLKFPYWDLLMVLHRVCWLQGHSWWCWAGKNQK